MSGDRLVALFASQRAMSSSRSAVKNSCSISPPSPAQPPKHGSKASSARVSSREAQVVVQVLHTNFHELYHRRVVAHKAMYRVRGGPFCLGVRRDSAGNASGDIAPSPVP